MHWKQNVKTGFDKENVDLLKKCFLEEVTQAKTATSCDKRSSFNKTLYFQH
jgi:hypothetical protein